MKIHPLQVNTSYTRNTWNTPYTSLGGCNGVPGVTGVPCSRVPHLTQTPCSTPDCIRLVWRDGLCWWCWHARDRRRQTGGGSDDA